MIRQHRYLSTKKHGDPGKPWISLRQRRKNRHGVVQMPVLLPPCLFCFPSLQLLPSHNTKSQYSLQFLSSLSALHACWPCSSLLAQHCPALHHRSSQLWVAGWSCTQADELAGENSRTGGGSLQMSPARNLVAKFYQASAEGVQIKITQRLSPGQFMCSWTQQKGFT